MQIIVDKDGNKQKKDTVKRCLKQSRDFIKPRGCKPGAIHSNESKNNKPVEINDKHRDKEFRHYKELEPTRFDSKLKKNYKSKIDGKEIG